MQAANSQPSQPVEEIKKTTCYMCACRCGIRARGSSGIMKQYSPARLLKPLKRKQGAERGDGAFEEIEWEEAFATLAERLAKIRATDPKQFALFTGRDQMQAL